MSETIIPQSSKQKHPGLNQKYVGSRQGEKYEAPMTKNASIKHHNPEYFKRQTDRKNQDSKPSWMGKQFSELTSQEKRERENYQLKGHAEEQKERTAKAYEKSKREQLTGKHEPKNISKDGVGFQSKLFSKGTMY